MLRRNVSLPEKLFITFVLVTEVVGKSVSFPDKIIHPLAFLYMVNRKEGCEPDP